MSDTFTGIASPAIEDDEIGMAYDDPQEPDETVADEDDAAEQPEADADGRATGSTSNATVRGGARITARAARSIIAKFRELESAEAAQLRLLATTLGVKDDPVEVTAHIVSTSRVQLAGVSELEAIADAAAESPFLAMAKATQHESQSRQLWALLTELGLATGSLPAKESAAAIAIAEAATKVTDAHRTLLAEARSLAKKA